MENLLLTLLNIARSHLYQHSFISYPATFFYGRDNANTNFIILFRLHMFFRHEICIELIIFINKRFINIFDTSLFSQRCN